MRIIRWVNDLDYHGMRLSAIFREAFHTFLNDGRRMIESLRRHAIPEDLPMPGQIRLSTA